jgi:hypothetical protein
MSWEQRLRIAHRSISVALGVAVPLMIYIMNGTLEPWMFVLALVIGVSYWLFFPILLP